MMRKLLVVALSLLSLAGFSQENVSSDAWSLQKCIDQALSNSLNVERSQYNVETSELNYKQAKFALFPTLNGNISGGYNWGRSVNPVTYAFTTAQNNSISPSASTQVTLFNGFRLQNNIQQTSRDYKASQKDLDKSKNDVILNVATLYLTVILNKELYENAKFQLSSSTHQLERTKKQVAAGALPISNELNLDAQVASNELNLINRENGVALSLLQLKQALQLPASTPIEVIIPEIGIESLLLDQDREAVYKIAMQNMPEIAGANLRVESALYAVKAARGNLYPRLTLNGSINSNYSSASRTRFVQDGGVVQTPTGAYIVDGGVNVPVFTNTSTGSFQETYLINNQLKDNIYRAASLNLSIPIFNGFQARYNVQRSIINQRIAEIDSRQASQTLRQSVETAYNDALASSKTYNSSLRQVTAREEAFRMTKQRFDIGAANYVEYQVAENDLFQAKSDLLRAKYDFIFKKKVLDFYQGKPIQL